MDVVDDGLLTRRGRAVLHRVGAAGLWLAMVTLCGWGWLSGSPTAWRFGILAAVIAGVWTVRNATVGALDEQGQQVRDAFELGADVRRLKL